MSPIVQMKHIEISPARRVRLVLQDVCIVMRRPCVTDAHRDIQDIWTRRLQTRLACSPAQVDTLAATTAI